MIGSRSAGTPGARQTVSCAAGGSDSGARNSASGEPGLTDHQAVESGAQAQAEGAEPTAAVGAAMRRARLARPMTTSCLVCAGLSRD